MKNYEIEYRDCTGMKCMVNDILSVSEKEAVIKLQLELIDNNDIMTELIYVEEVNDDDGGWTLEDGTPLSEDDQETLNYAFDTYVNEDGLTIKEIINNK